MRGNTDELGHKDPCSAVNQMPSSVSCPSAAPGCEAALKSVDVKTLTSLPGRVAGSRKRKMDSSPARTPQSVSLQPHDGPTSQTESLVKRGTTSKSPSTTGHGSPSQGSLRRSSRSSKVSRQPVELTADDPKIATSPISEVAAPLNAVRQSRRSKSGQSPLAGCHQPNPSTQDEVCLVSSPTVPSSPPKTVSVDNGAVSSLVSGQVVKSVEDGYDELNKVDGGHSRDRSNRRSSTLSRQNAPPGVTKSPEKTSQARRLSPRKILSSDDIKPDSLETPQRLGPQKSASQDCRDALCNVVDTCQGVESVDGADYDQELVHNDVSVNDKPLGSPSSKQSGQKTDSSSTRVADSEPLEKSRPRRRSDRQKTSSTIHSVASAPAGVIQDRKSADAERDLLHITDDNLDKPSNSLSDLPDMPDKVVLLFDSATKLVKKRNEAGNCRKSLNGGQLKVKRPRGRVRSLEPRGCQKKFPRVGRTRRKSDVSGICAEVLDDSSLNLPEDGNSRRRSTRPRRCKTDNNEAGGQELESTEEKDCLNLAQSGEELIRREEEDTDMTSSVGLDDSSMVAAPSDEVRTVQLI